MGARFLWLLIISASFSSMAVNRVLIISNDSFKGYIVEDGHYNWPFSSKTVTLQAEYTKTQGQGEGSYMAEEHQVEINCKKNTAKILGTLRYRDRDFRNLLMVLGPQDAFLVQRDGSEIVVDYVCK